MPTPTTAFPCCRSHDLFVPIEQYSVARTPGDEVYWFDWNSSFSGNATIRVSKLGGDAIVVREYRPSRYGKLRRFRGWKTPADWSRLEDAIVAANFWMLEESGGRRGLDGSTWRFAGRRRHDFHHIRRWSPDGALWDLGRLFFDQAGLTDIRLYY